MFLASFLFTAILSTSLIAQTWDDEMNHAYSLARKGESREAEQQYQKLIEAAQDHGREAKGLNNYAALVHTLGRFKEASVLYQKAIVLWEQGQLQNSEDMASTLNNLAESYRKQQQIELAAQQSRKALKVREALLADARATQQPTYNFEMKLASSLNNVGNAERELHHHDLARTYFLRSIAIKEKLKGKDSSDLWTVLNNLGAMSQDEGDFTTAENNYRRALKVLEPVADDGKNIALVLNNLGTVYLKQKRLEQARDVLERALQLLEATSIHSQLDLVPTLNNLSELESTEGHLAKAEPHLRRALAIAEKIAGKASVHAAAQLDNLGVLFLLEQKLTGAEELMRRALLIWTREIGSDDVRSATTMHHLVQVLGLQKRYTEAEVLLNEELKIWEKLEGQFSKNRGLALVELGTLKYAKRETKEARRILAQAIAILEPKLEVGDPELTRTRAIYAKILGKANAKGFVR